MDYFDFLTVCKYDYAMESRRAFMYYYLAVYTFHTYYYIICKCTMIYWLSWTIYFRIIIWIIMVICRGLSIMHVQISPKKSSKVLRFYCKKYYFEFYLQVNCLSAQFIDICCITCYYYLQQAFVGKTERKKHSSWVCTPNKFETVLSTPRICNITDDTYMEIIN